MRLALLLLLVSGLARAEGPFALGGFAHERHAKLSGDKACATCHAGPPAQTPPTKASCEPCHDGKRAFSTVEAACRRCHKPPKKAVPLPPLAAPAAFAHARHDLPCARCHTLDRAGRPLPPRHSACADAGCHGDDFRAPTATTCSVCHVGTEPWRPLHADAPRRVVTEFGAQFSHVGHKATDCKQCHTGITGGPALRIGAGHDACASCHTELSTCTQCHAAGLLPSRDARRQREPWSVARRFRHDAAHADACISCHTDLSADVASLRPPAKPTCAPCHDGNKAFKMTGHGCVRCHGG